LFFQADRGTTKPPLRGIEHKTKKNRIREPSKKKEEVIRMKRLILLVAVLLCSALALGQHQRQAPYQLPPDPLDRNPAAQMPPDTKAPLPQELSPAEMEQQIQTKLDSDPALSGASVKVTVDDNSVVLFGTVNSEQEHDLALQIAASYSGKRKIVDQITVRGRA
jgi:hypothetical protein